MSDSRSSDCSLCWTTAAVLTGGPASLKLRVSLEWVPSVVALEEPQFTFLFIQFNTFFINCPAATKKFVLFSFHPSFFFFICPSLLSFCSLLSPADCPMMYILFHSTLQCSFVEPSTVPVPHSCLILSHILSCPPSPIPFSTSSLAHLPSHPPCSPVPLPS